MSITSNAALSGLKEAIVMKEDVDGCIKSERFLVSTRRSAIFESLTKDP